MPCGAGPIEVRLTLAPVREAIAVSATRSEAPVSQLGASVTVFDASDLERRQSPAVADLLTASPGVTIARTGGYGSVTSLFVRGGESDYNKVLIDGIPVNEPGATSTSATSRARTSNAWKSSAAHSPRSSARTRCPA